MDSLGGKLFRCHACFWVSEGEKTPTYLMDSLGGKVSCGYAYFCEEEWRKTPTDLIDSFSFSELRFIGSERNRLYSNTQTHRERFLWILVILSMLLFVFVWHFVC